MINRTTFYTYARRSPFGGRLSREQIAGMEAMFTAWDKHGDGDLRKLANGLAQCFHETGGRMVPVRETFAASTAQAIARLDAAWKAGRLGQVSKPYWRDGWFGRGRLQTTHYDNYLYAHHRTGLDCVNNPDVLLTEEGDAKVFWPSLFQGWWTRGRHRLGMYFNATVDDPKGARRIVNGTDKASLIATYHKAFLDALNAADEATPQPKDVTPEAATPDDVSPAESKPFWMTVLGWFTSLGLTFPNIDNAYGLIAFLAILAVGGIGAWAYFTGRLSLNRVQ